MAKPGFDVDDLKAGMAASRKKPLNFGMSVASKPEDTVVLLNRITKPEVLQKQAKKLGGSPKVAAGTVETKGKEMTFTCLSEPPKGSAKRLKEFFKKIVGETVKVVLQDSSGNVDSDDEDAAATPQDEAGKDDRPAKTDGNALSGQVEVALRKMQPKIKPALEADPRAKAVIAKLVGDTKTAGAEGDAVKVKTLLTQLNTVLTKLGAKLSGGTADAPGSKLSLVKLGKARIEWVKVHSDAKKEMDRLKAHIEAEYREMPDAAGAVTNALATLDGTINRLEDKLHEELDEVLNAREETRAGHVTTARNTVDQFVKLVDSDPVFKELDSNDILPDVEITAPVKAKLMEISNALG